MGTTYLLVLKGATDRSPEGTAQVKDALGKRLSLSSTALDTMFERLPAIVRKEPEFERAQLFARVLESIGAEVEIVEKDAPAAPPPKAPSGMSLDQLMKLVGGDEEKTDETVIEETSEFTIDETPTPTVSAAPGVIPEPSTSGLSLEIESTESPSKPSTQFVSWDLDQPPIDTNNEVREEVPDTDVELKAEEPLFSVDEEPPPPPEETEKAPVDTVAAPAEEVEEIEGESNDDLDLNTDTEPTIYSPFPNSRFSIPGVWRFAALGIVLAIIGVFNPLQSSRFLAGGRPYAVTPEAVDHLLAGYNSRSESGKARAASANTPTGLTRWKQQKQEGLLLITAEYMEMSDRTGFFSLLLEEGIPPRPTTEALIRGEKPRARIKHFEVRNLKVVKNSQQPEGAPNPVVSFTADRASHAYLEDAKGSNRLLAQFTVQGSIDPATSLVTAHWQVQRNSTPNTQTNVAERSADGSFALQYGGDLQLAPDIALGSPIPAAPANPETNAAPSSAPHAAP